jgi:hypothetical protein
MTRPDAGTVVVLAAVALLCPAAVLVTGAGVAVPSVVLGVVAAGALVVAGVLRGPEELGVALLLAAVGTTPWNAVAVGGVKLAPALLAGATVLLAVPVLAGRVPLRVRPWMLVLGAAIAAVAVLTWFLPPDPDYFAARYVGDGAFVSPPADQVGGISAVQGLEWLVAVVVLPVVVGVACHGRPRLPARLADAWVLGASVSAGVAVTDQLGLTHLSAAILPFVDVGGRQAGLSVQPNHVAVAAAITVPVAVWRLIRGGSWGPRVVAAVCLAAIGGGLVVSASRGAMVGAVLAALAVLLTAPRTRRLTLPLVGAGLLAAVLAVAAVPSLLGATGERLRFAGAESADASDAVRAGIGAQAWQDFLVSPVHGIGLEVALQGHDIYLQLLASGGALLLLGFLAALVALTVDVRALLRHPVPAGPPGFVAALALAVGTWLVVCVIENHLTDLFLYVPLALLAALRSAVPSPPAVPDHVPPPDAPAPDAPAPDAALVAAAAEGPRA